MTSTLTKPTGLTVIPENIPEEQKNRPQWVTWSYEWVEGEDGNPGKWDKPPRNARTGDDASTTNSATWSTFADAVQAYEMGGYDGIGYVVAHDDPFFVADLDHCIVNGKVSAMARSIVDRTRAYLYWEVSPSGTGLRAIGIGTFPQHRKKNDVFEVYRTARYVTMTGHVFEGCDQISGDATAIITEIHREQFGDPPTERTGTRQASDSPADDIEVIERLRRCKNGATFDQLMQGSTANHDGDDSRADASLIERLLWANGGDVEQAVRIASTSMLWRPKWETRRGDTDYIHYTAERILATMSDFYQPHYGHVTPTLQPPVSGETVCLSASELAHYQAIEVENKQLRARVYELEELASRRAGIIRNKKLAGARVLAPAVVDYIAAKDSAGEESPPDGLYQVTMEGRFTNDRGEEQREGLAVNAGISADTAGRYLDQLAAAGLIRQETHRILINRNGIVTKEPRRFIGRPLDCENAIGHAQRFIEADLQRNIGGKREPRLCQHCDADLDISGTKTTTTITCLSCESIIEEQTTHQKTSQHTGKRVTRTNRIEPMPQVAASPEMVTDEAPAPMPHAAAYKYVITTEEDRPNMPQVAACPPAGGLVDLVRDTAPDRNAAAWFARESEHQRFLENSIAVGD